MLGTWAMIWKHAEYSSNTSLAKELRDAGQVAQGDALGWHDPDHATAALTFLLKHSHRILQDARYNGPPIHLAKAVISCPNVTASG